MTDRYEVLGHTRDADWHERRAQGIGASEISAVLGVNRWKTALDVYADKVGAQRYEAGEAALWGNLLEPVVLEEFGKRAGVAVFADGRLLRSVERPWMLATLDGHTRDGDTLIPVEVKTASIYLEDDWADGAPEAYQAQLQQQMTVLGAPYGYLACLLGGQRLMWSRLEHDPILERRIIRAGSEFWRRVEEHDPPPAIDERDRGALGRLYPEEDGRAIELPADVSELIEEYAELTADIRGLCKQKDTLAARIQEALGPAERGYCANGWGASWKLQHRNEHTVKASSTRVLRIQKPKERKVA
jgi:putative phage-type endonuclease